MATEIELKLTLPPSSARHLATHPVLAGAPGRRKRVENTYYDTPALDLTREWVAVRRRLIGGKWLLTVKSTEPASAGLACRSEWERPAEPGDFDFSMVDDTGLRARLERHSPALREVFTTHFTRTTWHLFHAGAEIEVAFDRGSIAANGRREAICEIELELLAGETTALFALARVLQSELPLALSTASKAERGYALYAGTPRQPVKAAPPALAEDGDSLAAFRNMALNCLDQLQRNEAGVRAGGDPEYLHQARIALRRLRACLNLFAPLLPPEFLRAYQEAWRDFAHSLNAARNWDVFTGETLPPLLAAFPDHHGMRRLETTAHSRAKQARRLANARFGSADYRRLLLYFTADLHALPAESTPPLAEFARARLKKRAAQARRLAARLPDLDAADIHRLRLRCKKLRYTLDFLAPTAAAKPYLRALSRVQTALGEYNDHATAAQLLAEMPATSASRLAAGWVVGRQTLLAARLARSIEPWLKARPPWKHG